MKSWTLLSALALALALFSQDSAGQTPSPTCLPPPHYTLTVVPLRPTGINDAGEIVGTTEAHRAAFWTKAGGLQEIAVPPGFDSSEGIGLNRAGHIIAIAINLKTNQRQGFTYVDGKVKLLPGNHSRPFAINDADEIAGETTLPSGVSEPILWKGQQSVELGGCCGGAASGINNHAQAIGNTYDQQGRYQAFLWDNPQGVQLIGPPKIFSSALAVNDQAHVLIESFTQGALLYQDGKLNPLTLSSKFPNHPKNLNNCDVVVGSFGAFTDSGWAFTWDKSAGFRDLNDLLVPHSKLHLREALAINSQGEIVGWGEYGRDEDAGFLLVPQP